MPFLHVRSLPLADAFDAANAVRAISARFAGETGTDERHVTVTWQTLEPHHYAAGGETAGAQPPAGHPVLVELVAPDLHPPDRREAMLVSAARAVAAAAGVASDNVFVEMRPARSGHVLDGGEIERW